MQFQQPFHKQRNVRDDHLRSLAGEGVGDGAADPLGRAGSSDEDDLTVKIQHDLNFLSA